MNKLRVITIVGNGIALPQAAGYIPSGDRPTRTIRFPCASQQNDNGYWGTISADGSISLYKNGNQITTSTSYMIFNVSYFVD